MRATRAPGRPARASEVRALSTGLLFTAAVCALTALVPFSATAPRRLDAALGVVATALGTLLRVRASRTLTWHVHAVLVTGCAGMTVCVGASTTAPGPAVTALGFVWLAVFVAAFETRRALVLHLGLVAVGLRAGLAVAHAPSAWSAGVARWNGEDVEAWMHAADTALYAQKRSRGTLRHATPRPV